MSSKNVSRKQFYLYIIWMLAILCGLVALIGLFLILHESSFVAGSITTQGNIIDEGEDYSKNGGPILYVVVQFVDTQGMTQTETIYEGDGGVSPHFHDPIGQTITLRYLANDPHTVEIEGINAGKVYLYQLESLVFGLLSFTFCIWGIIIGLRRSRHKRLSKLLLKV